MTAYNDTSDSEVQALVERFRRDLAGTTVGTGLEYAIATGRIRAIVDPGNHGRTRGLDAEAKLVEIRRVLDALDIVADERTPDGVR